MFSPQGPGAYGDALNSSALKGRGATISGRTHEKSSYDSPGLNARFRLTTRSGCLWIDGQPQQPGIFHEGPGLNTFVLREPWSAPRHYIFTTSFLMHRASCRRRQHQGARARIHDGPSGTWLEIRCQPRSRELRVCKSLTGPGCDDGGSQPSGGWKRQSR